MEGQLTFFNLCFLFCIIHLSVSLFHSSLSLWSIFQYFSIFLIKLSGHAQRRRFSPQEDRVRGRVFIHKVRGRVISPYQIIKYKVLDHAPSQHHSTANTKYQKNILKNISHVFILKSEIRIPGIPICFVKIIHHHRLNWNL